MKKGLLITGGIFLTLAIFFGIWWVSMNVSYTNDNNTLKEGITAQQNVCKTYFDKMFKDIAQIAQVAEQKMDKSREAFKEIYPALIEGRYSKGDGALMKWITESNPQFDLNAAGSLYDKLAVVIESNREGFFVEQQKLIDKNREQHLLVKNWPGNWFLESNDTLAIKLITSANTEKVFSTGQENEIDIFNEAEPPTK
jgi:hypothetical protein